MELSKGSTCEFLRTFSCKKSLKHQHIKEVLPFMEECLSNFIIDGNKIHFIVKIVDVEVITKTVQLNYGGIMCYITYNSVYENLFANHLRKIN